MNGGMGDDLLDGGLGADTLTGSSGTTSRFSSALGNGNIDYLQDFNHADDTVPAG